MAEKENHFKTICKRSSPKSLLKIIKKLSLEQKNCVKEMGFKSLLKLELDELPSSLGLFVVKSFDIEKKVLKVINREIKVDRQSVNEMLGIPMVDLQKMNVTANGYPNFIKHKTLD